MNRTLPGVVEVQSESESGRGSGAGFIVEATGLVVTSLHVVRGATRVVVKLNSGEAFEKVDVVGFDVARDLVLLQVPGFDLPTLPMGNSNSVAVGDDVFAVGHPAGLTDTVSRGIVSSLRVLESGTKVLQTDAALSPGNSGGPLLNSSGEVIGVVSFGIVERSLNFAVPINYARGLLQTRSRLTLAELNAAIGAGNEDFSETRPLEESRKPKSDLSGTWRTTNGALLLSLRSDGDYLYGSRIGGEGAFTFELHRSGASGYSGLNHHSFTCTYPSPWDSSPVHVSCNISRPIEMRMVSTQRIEGRILQEDWPEPSPNSSISKRAYAYRDACRSCGQKLQKTWIDLILIPTE